MSARKRRIKRKIARVVRLYQQYWSYVPGTRKRYCCAGLIVAATQHPKRNGYMQKAVDAMNAGRRK